MVVRFLHLSMVLVTDNMSDVGTTSTWPKKFEERQGGPVSFSQRRAARAGFRKGHTTNVQAITVRAGASLNTHTRRNHNKLAELHQVAVGTSSL